MQPDMSSCWWSYLNPIVEEFWASLSVDAKLIAFLTAINDETMNNLYSDLE